MTVKELIETLERIYGRDCDTIIKLEINDGYMDIGSIYNMYDFLVLGE